MVSLHLRELHRHLSFVFFNHLLTKGLEPSISNFGKTTEPDISCEILCNKWLNSSLYINYFSDKIMGMHSLFHLAVAAATAAKSLQSCPTLCDPIDGSPPGSPVPGILQARTLEWVAVSSSNAWKWKVKVKSLSPVWLLATPLTAAYQAPPSMGFSRQEYWSGVPLLSPPFSS